MSRDISAKDSASTTAGIDDGDDLEEEYSNFTFDEENFRRMAMLALAPVGGLLAFAAANKEHEKTPIDNRKCAGGERRMSFDDGAGFNTGSNAVEAAPAAAAAAATSYDVKTPLNKFVRGKHDDVEVDMGCKTPPDNEDLKVTNETGKSKGTGRIDIDGRPFIPGLIDLEGRPFVHGKLLPMNFGSTKNININASSANLGPPQQCQIMNHSLYQAWIMYYKELVAYRQKFGHCRVKKSEYNSLHSWVCNQRQSFLGGTLERDRVILLSQIDFDWCMPWSTPPWFCHYYKLKAFKLQYGHTNVPIGHPLARWVKLQRKRYRSGRLSADEVAMFKLIESESPVCVCTPLTAPAFLSTKQSSTINLQMAERKNWTSITGNLRAVSGSSGSPGSILIDLTQDEDGAKTGVTDLTQGEDGAKTGVPQPVAAAPTKHTPSKSSGNLTSKSSSPKKRKRTPPGQSRSRDVRWAHFYDRLVAFRKEFGHLHVKQYSSIREHFKLASWVYNQKKKFRLGTLKREHVMLLNKIGLLGLGLP